MEESIKPFDLVIAGGSVVTPADGVRAADVGIRGESIAAIDRPGAFDQSAGRVIDASGCIVMPGGVDPHVHFKLRLPALDGGIIPDEGQEYSYAAAIGGTTTIIDFAMWQREEWELDHDLGLTAAVAAKKREADGKMAVDYPFHALLIGNPPFEVIDEIGSVIEQGIPTIKTSSACPPWTSDDGHRLGVMMEVERHGGLHVLHAEDQAIIDWLTAKYVRRESFTAPTRRNLAGRCRRGGDQASDPAESAPGALSTFCTWEPAREPWRSVRRDPAARRCSERRCCCYLSFTSEELWDDSKHGLLWTTGLR